MSEVLLTKSSIAEPKNVFYGYYSCEESQKFLWQLFKMAFSGKKSLLNRQEWANLISFYENLDDFLSECYQENKRDKLSE